MQQPRRGRHAYFKDNDPLFILAMRISQLKKRFTRKEQHPHLFQTTACSGMKEGIVKTGQGFLPRDRKAK